MTENMQKLLLETPLSGIFDRCPAARDYLMGLRLESLDESLPYHEAVRFLPERSFEEFETSRVEVAEMLASLIEASSRERERREIGISSVRILGGRDKLGRPERLDITVRAGETVAVVGPTGAGKSCLLEDIECLAQRDTPTGRLVLVNGVEPDDELRFSMDSRPVAQLSQNMNFVMDLTVGEFLSEHAQCRMAPEDVIKDVFECANDLAGERFSRDTNVTRLSGGQSRALMIADTLLLSRSPVLLIDEIENAGIDRKRALSLFRETGKIIFLSTHDPLLALSVDRRMSVRGGAVDRVIEASGAEREAIGGLERMDAAIQRLRDKIRAGETVSGDISDWLEG